MVNVNIFWWIMDKWIHSMMANLKMTTNWFQNQTLVEEFELIKYMIQL